MILLPDSVTSEEVAEARDAASKKKPNPAIARVRREHFAEGRAAQIMHLGPYADEPPTVEHLHGWIMDQGLRLRGKHHEIYLSDPARSAPERMKTILRQPVE
jgi:hypothetical protein